jgi:uncharacterized protein RhaS with RHS repeats
VALTYGYAGSTNRLASVVSGGTTIASNTYDPGGHTTSDGLRAFVHDARGRMVQATFGGMTTTYLYNINGQRVKKSNASVTRIFLYDVKGHVLGEYDGTGTLIQEVVWLGDTPLAVVTSGAVGYVWTDHLNTPREVPNTAGQSRWKWDSLPFGQIFRA